MELINSFNSLNINDEQLSNSDITNRELLNVCDNYDIDRVVYLLENTRTDINTTNMFGYTPLFIAIAKSTILVFELLKYKPLINTQVYSGETPLHRACYNECIGIKGVGLCIVSKK